MILQKSSSSRISMNSRMPSPIASKWKRPSVVPQSVSLSMTYFILSTAFFIAGIFIIYWLHNQYHLDIVVAPTPPPTHAPLISVCIPARNEERNIRTCVEAMLAQDYPNLEVIVLDDRSSDATPLI